MKMTSSSKWIRNYHELTPSNFPAPPKGMIIANWARFSKDPNIWIPFNEQDYSDKRYFYCSLCEKWLVYGDTISNINRHIKGHNTTIRDSEANSQDPDFIEKVTQNNSSNAQNITKFILLNGLPFQLIEDCHLKEISSSLRNRKSLSNYCKITSQKIIDLITKELTLFDLICISIDEWKDKLKRPYLGVTAQAVSNTRLSYFTLGMKPLIGEKIDGELIANTLHQVLDQYNIEGKIIGCVSDSGSNMILGLRSFPFQRLPCTCHLFNNLMKVFIKSHWKCFQEIINIQLECSSSKFTAFCINVGSELKSVPSYCAVRWYSMCRVIEGLSRLKHHIIEYRTKYNLIAVPPHIWEDIDHLYPVFKSAQEIIQILESDSFGAISYTLRGFSIFKDQIEYLPEKFLAGKRAVSEKIQKYWNSYRPLWDPFLFAATRLNPALAVHMILETDEILKGDRMILDMMKKFDENEKIEYPKRKSNILCCYDNGPISSCETNFEFYKTQQLNDIVDLYEYWKSKLNTQLAVLANVALKVLSTLSSSASVEREFSSSRRALGFQRLKMNPEKVENIIMIVGNQEIAEKVMK